MGGLAAGYFCARTGLFDVTVLERRPEVGGLCGSFQYNGFTLDYGAHKLYSVIPGILEEMRTLMGDRLLKVAKRNRLLLCDRLTAYPLRFGDLMRTLGIHTAAKLGIGFGFQLARNFVSKHEPRSYEEYIVQRFGRATYKLVFEPLADKVWGQPATLHAEMARTRVPASGGGEVVLKLLGIKKETAETNAEFFYYPREGFGELPNALMEGIIRLGGRVLTQAVPVEARRNGQNVTSVIVQLGSETLTLPCDLMISAIPMADLGRILLGSRNEEFQRYVGALEFRHLVLVYLFICKPSVMHDQWVFCPDRNYLFSRVFEQKQMCAALGAPDKTALCCDFTCSSESETWHLADDDLANRCIADLERVGWIHRKDVYDCLVVRHENFYPRYGLDYRQRLDKVWASLREIPNLLLTGRVGMYNYNNADHCLDMGRFIANCLAEEQSVSDIWQNLAERTSNYRIVD